MSDTLMMHRTRLLLHACLIALLLILQQGAVLHALSHLSFSGSNTQQEHGAPPGSEICAKCLGYAQASGALHSSTIMLAAPAPVVVQTLIALPSVIPRTVSSYLTRAPPVLV